MGILLIIVGGLLFIYLNIKCRVKINFSYTFLYVNIYMIFLKKKYIYEKTINYLVTERILTRYKKSEIKHIYENRNKYIRYFKKIFNIFYIKNIFIYPECISEKQSISIEFVVVNRMLKKSILNG